MKEASVQQKRRAAWGLLFLLLLHAAANFAWVRLDNHPIIMDEDKHMLVTRGAWTILTGGEGGDLSTAERLARVWSRPIAYPPGTYLAGALFIALLGPSPDALAFSNTAWFLLLILAVYVLARAFLPPTHALFAAGVVSLTPIVYAFSRYYSVDYPATAAAAWAVAALAHSGGFLRTRWVALFAISAAFTLLTKPIVALCWAGPLVPMAWSACRRVLPRGPRGGVDRGALVRLAVHVPFAGIVALGPALHWHLTLREWLFQEWMRGHSAGGQVFHFPSSSAYFGIYPFLTVNLGMFLPLFLLALAGLTVLVLHPRLRNSAGWAVVLWPALLYLVLTLFVQQKEMRYFFPAVPALALCAACAVLAIPFGSLRRVSGAVLMTVLAVQFLTLTFGGAGPVLHGRGGDLVALDLKGYAFSRAKLHDVYYPGGLQLSFYRNALISDSYSYCPPHRGRNFINLVFETIVDDVNRRLGPPGAVRFASVPLFDDIPGLSNVQFYNTAPNLFAHSRWGRGALSARPLEFAGVYRANTPERLVQRSGEADYLVVKLPPTHYGFRQWTMWRTGLEKRGYRMLRTFFDGGYGQCRAGVYLVARFDGT